VSDEGEDQAFIRCFLDGLRQRREVLGLPWTTSKASSMRPLTYPTSRAR
jgi:hypothetical protein